MKVKMPKKGFVESKGRSAALKFPKEKRNELHELDRVMRVVGTLPCGLMVYVRTDEHAYAPHVHICDIKTRGCRFHASVLLTEWQYFIHPWDEYPYCEGRRDYLRHVKQLLRMFHAKHEGGPETNWEYAARCWNECRYPSFVVSREIPKFNGMCYGAYEWIDMPSETTDWATIAGLKCRVFIRGPEWEVSQEPHFHIASAKRARCKFWFEISLADILSRDELKLVAMRDSRDPEKEVVRRFADECSWEGYEDLRDGVRAYLAAEEVISGRTPGQDDTHLHSIVRAWDRENHNEGIRGQVIDDWLRENGIRVLPKYARLVEESHERGIKCRKR